MWFVIALIAFLNTGLLCVLLVQDMRERGFGIEPEDRITTCWMLLGLTCTLVNAAASMLAFL